MQATLKFADQVTVALGTSTTFLRSLLSTEPKTSCHLPLCQDGRIDYKKLEFGDLEDYIPLRLFLLGEETIAPTCES